MDRSCRICGFFKQNPTTDNIGYCLYFDEINRNNIWRKICYWIGFVKFTGESLKIPDGDEKSTALKCKKYFRTVPDMSRGEFLNWRVGIEIFNTQMKIFIVANFIAFITMAATCILLFK